MVVYNRFARCSLSVTGGWLFCALSALRTLSILITLNILIALGLCTLAVLLTLASYLVAELLFLFVGCFLGSFVGLLDFLDDSTSYEHSDENKEKEHK